MFLDLSMQDPGADLLKACAPPVSSVTDVFLPGFAEDGQDVTISVVTSEAQRSDASALINRMYAWRGYGEDHALTRRAAQTTFSVVTGGRTIGTLTLTVDSDDGLATDATFRSELNTYRRVPGASVCELTRFAFDAVNPSKRLLAALFHVIFIYGKCRHGCTDLFIEVAQRHRRFYEAMLGFERVCAVKTNESVGVPSQLMRLDVTAIQDRIESHRNAPDEPGGRSLYPLFFSAQLEQRILTQLAAETRHPAPVLWRHAASGMPLEVIASGGLPFGGMAGG